MTEETIVTPPPVEKKTHMDFQISKPTWTGLLVVALLLVQLAQGLGWINVDQASKINTVINSLNSVEASQAKIEEKQDEHAVIIQDNSAKIEEVKGVVQETVKDQVKEAVKDAAPTLAPITKDDIQKMIDQAIRDLLKPPTPKPIDVTPKPNPNPVPGPPVPPVVSDDPVAEITVKDTQGKQINSEADSNQQLIITSEKSIHGKQSTSIIWKVEAFSMIDNSSVAVQTWTSADQTMMTVTTPGVYSKLKLLQLVAKGDKAAYKEVQIKCGNGSLPPPGPLPVPPDPTPNPSPDDGTAKAKHVFFAVVADKTNLNADQAISLDFLVTWNSFRTAGNDWLIFSPNSKEKKAQMAQASLSARGITTPAIVVYDLDTQAVLGVEKLPTATEFPALAKKYTGGSL